MDTAGATAVVAAATALATSCAVAAAASRSAAPAGRKPQDDDASPRTPLVSRASKARLDSTVRIDREIAGMMSQPVLPAVTSRGNNVLVIGVCGGSGSGKSTVSEKLVAGIGAHHLAYLCHDWYYRDQSHIPDMTVRANNNYDHPNALETELLVEHVKALKQMHDVYVPDYNFAEHTRFGGLEWRQSHSKLVTAAPIVLVEGILLFENPELREIIDIRVFVDADADLRFIRRMSRDIAPQSQGGRGRHVDDVVAQFTSTVRPMHNLFVEPMKRYAHVVLPMNEPNETADRLMLAVVSQRVEEAKAIYNASVLADRKRWMEASARPGSGLSDSEGLQVVAAFRVADENQDGSLSLIEARTWFANALANGGTPAGAGSTAAGGSRVLSSFRRLFDAVDLDGSQTLHLPEFQELCGALKVAYAEAGGIAFPSLLSEVGQQSIGAKSR